MPPKYAGACRADAERERGFITRFPKIPWREPQEVFNVDDTSLTPHYACRICVALWGMRGRDVYCLATDRERVRAEIEQIHGPS